MIKIDRPPCIECKHLLVDKHEYYRLRLAGKLQTDMDSECLKNVYQVNEHKVSFLATPVDQNTPDDTFAGHVQSCTHFEQST